MNIFELIVWSAIFTAAVSLVVWISDLTGVPHYLVSPSLLLAVVVAAPLVNRLIIKLRRKR